MATRAGRAIFEIGLDDAQFKAGVRNIEKHSKQAEGSLRGISQAINLAVFRELATVGVQAVRSIVEGIGDLAARGAEVSAMERSFDSLTAAAGESGAVMKGTLREATMGLVDDMTLMQATNKSLLLGLPATAESMGTLAKTATVLGRAMGQDAAKSLDDLTTALGRSSPLILDNLGLTVKVGQANEEYARKLGKTAEQLTDAEKKMAFYEAAMAAAEKKVAELGEVQLTFGDRLQQVAVFLTNFKDALSKAVANSPVLAAGMERVSAALSAAFGGDSQKAIDLVIGLIEDLAIFLVKAGEVGVSVAQGLAFIWGQLNHAFNTMMFAMTASLGGLVQSLGDFIALHARIPGVGAAFRALAEPIQALAADVNHLALGFKTQADDAVKGAAAQIKTLGEVKSTLGGVASAMEEAGRASRGASDGIRETALASRQAAEDTLATSQLTAAEMKRQAEQRAREAAAAATLIADTERRLQQELALSRAEGLQKELLELDFKRQEEIRGLESLKEKYLVEYTDLVAQINAKYEGMRAKAVATHASIEVAAAQQGFRTRAELEAMAQKAHETFTRMKDSGLYTTRTLQAAWEAYEKARGELTAEQTEFQLSSGEAVLQGALQIFGALGQRFKAAAIAGAIIATYSAVAKALASAPWPANLALAAGALAAGLSNVARIRSSEAGFAEGTPNLDFARFGPVSMQPLHGDEAVIPRGGGHQLALEIGEAMPAQEEMLSELRAMRNLLESQPRETGRALRGALLHVS